MDSLLPYFEHELSLFNKQSKEFAKKYPKIANRLLMGQDTVDDPHIERLIQAFSLISARINKKLDDSYADFTESLLEVVYPDYLKPFPSVSIAQFNLGVQGTAMTEAVQVAKGTSFLTQKVSGTSCQFQSTQDVTLLPLQIDRVSFETHQEVYDDQHGLLNGCISIKFKGLGSSFDYQALLQHAIEVYIDEDASQGTSLWDILWCDVKQSHIHGRQVHKIKGSPFEITGFDPEQQILPSHRVSNAASTLLKEYFYFPEKFNFLRLNLAQSCPTLMIDNTGFEIRCYFKFDKKNTIRLKNLQQLSASSIKLFCTPVVNLFKTAAKPIQVTHRSVYYDLVPDTRALFQHEIYEVTKIIESKQVNNRLLQREYHPFYALNHYEQHDEGRYYHIKRDKDMAEFKQGFEYQIMFVEKQREDLAGAASMSASLLCTNRDLPAQIAFGQSRGDLFSEGMTGFSSLSLLKQPTRTARFEYTGEERWRLISLISLNFLSLAAQDAELMKEYLSLYDITQSAANKQLIEGIVSVTTSIKARRIQRLPQPGFVRGTVIDIRINQKHFASVSIRQFAHLLAHVFGYHASLNSFVEVAISNAVTKEEIYRCQPRSGLSPLI
ncbi:type VI secretion system baseplate subunit TssF [uncultured Psychrobacter sp.]|uniref:type VI secretion system baseplate subunit TssF n=1 Tax=uncultured Psychrobacter sp. TaxID=259303 RepID=UPI0034586520